MFELSRFYVQLTSIPLTSIARKQIFVKSVFAQKHL